MDEDEKQFKVLLDALQKKGEELQQMHEESKKTTKNAEEEHSYQSQTTGALIAIAQALNVQNEIALVNIDAQLKTVVQLMADEL